MLLSSQTPVLGPEPQQLGFRVASCMGVSGDTKLGSFVIKKTSVPLRTISRFFELADAM